MTLFDKSLKLALFASVALLTACPTDADKDTDDTDIPKETDDTDLPPPDTGFGAAFWKGSITTTEAEGVYTFESGKFGLDVFGILSEEWACTVLGNLSLDAEPAAAGCPDCLWAFDLTSPMGAVPEGPYCETMIDAELLVADGLDETMNYSWGFATHHTHVQTSGTYEFEETMFLRVDTTDAEWQWFTYNSAQLDRFNIDATTTPGTVDFSRLILNSAGTAPFYYNYYLE